MFNTRILEDIVACAHTHDTKHPHTLTHTHTRPLVYAHTFHVGQNKLKIHKHFRARVEIILTYALSGVDFFLFRGPCVLYCALMFYMALVVSVYEPRRSPRPVCHSFGAFFRCFSSLTRFEYIKTNLNNSITSHIYAL